MKLKRKPVIITAIALTCVIGGSLYFVKKNKSNQQSIVLPDMIQLKKDTLNQSLTVTGTVNSTNSYQVVSMLATSKITSINVKEGDVVKKGQVLFQLDTYTIDQQIKAEKDSLQTQLEAAQKAYDNAVLAKDRGWGTFDQARKAKEEACNNSPTNSLKVAMDTAATAYTQAKVAYQQASALASEVLKKYNDSCLVTPNTSETDDSTPQNTVPSNCNQALMTQYEGLKLDADLKQQALSAAEATYNQASNAYTAANSSCETLSKQFETIDIQQQGLEAQVTTTKENLEKLSSSTSTVLENLYKQRNDYTITAPIDGTVTNMNAVLNNLPTGTLAIINDTSNLKVNCNVAEYDIQSLKQGMKANITSDANDQIYQGQITSIGLTSNTTSLQNATSTSGTVTFPIEINLPTDANLMIGMNANVEITLNSTNEGYVVPRDAIETKEGKNYVYIFNQSYENFNPVEINILLTNDYYASIEGSGLNENTKIKASVIETVDNPLMEAMQGNNNE